MMGDNMSKLIKKIYIWDIISLVFKPNWCFPTYFVNFFM